LLSIQVAPPFQTLKSVYIVFFLNAEFLIRVPVGRTQTPRPITAPVNHKQNPAIPRAKKVRGSPARISFSAETRQSQTAKIILQRPNGILLPFVRRFSERSYIKPIIIR
jgi:hypothetical protein